MAPSQPDAEDEDCVPAAKHIHCRWNTFVKVHVIYNFKGISIFYITVTDSIFILYDAGREL